MRQKRNVYSPHCLYDQHDKIFMLATWNVQSVLALKGHVTLPCVSCFGCCTWMCKQYMDGGGWCMGHGWFCIVFVRVRGIFVLSCCVWNRSLKRKYLFPFLFMYKFPWWSNTTFISCVLLSCSASLYSAALQCSFALHRWQRDFAFFQESFPWIALLCHLFQLFCKFKFIWIKNNIDNCHKYKLLRRLRLWLQSDTRNYFAIN